MNFLMYLIVKKKTVSFNTKIFYYLFNYWFIYKDLPELVYKALGKLNYYLFPRYLDKTSKKYLINLNDLIIKINADNSIKSIIQSYETHSNACVLTQSK